MQNGIGRDGGDKGFDNSEKLIWLCRSAHLSCNNGWREWAQQCDGEYRRRMGSKAGDVVGKDGENRVWKGVVIPQVDRGGGK